MKKMEEHNQTPTTDTANAPHSEMNGKRKHNGIIALAIVLGVCLIGCGIFFTYKYLHNHSNSTDIELIPVKVGERWGFVDHKGNLVIAPEYRAAEYFSEGLAMVTTTDGYCGYIDTKGEMVIAANYLNATTFSEGLAFVVEEGGCPTCIDKNGEKVFDLPQAQLAGKFCDGLALFNIPDGEDDGLFGYVDKDGKEVIKPQFEMADDFSEGLALVFNGRQHGYINKKGEMVIKPQFEMASPFSEGLAAVSNGELYGYVNQKGQMVIPFQYEDALPFYEGFAGVQLNGKWHFINTKGEMMKTTKEGFEIIGSFSNGVAPVKKDGLFGYIDKNGKMVIDNQFTDAGSFIGDIAPVIKGNLCGFINRKGKMAIKAQFDDILTPGQHEFYFVCTNYYDAEAFLAHFLNGFSAHEADGLKAGATLGDLQKHNRYQKGLESALTMYSAKFIEPTLFDDEITQTSTTIYLMGKAYDYEENRLAEEFCTSTRIKNIEYEFSMKGVAQERTAAIAGLLWRRLANIYGLTTQGHNHFEIENLDPSAFFKTLEGKEFSFIIMGSSGDLTLSVFFDQESYAKYVQQLRDEVRTILYKGGPMEGEELEEAYALSDEERDMMD